MTEIQSVKSASLNLYSELKLAVLPPEENNKGCKTKKKREILEHYSQSYHEIAHNPAPLF